MNLFLVYLLSVLLEKSGTAAGWLLPRSTTTSTWMTRIGFSRAPRIALFLQESEQKDQEEPPRRFKYDLGVGKNKPFDEEASKEVEDASQTASQWMIPEPVVKPQGAVKPIPAYNRAENKTTELVDRTSRTTRRILARDEESRSLKKALWDEAHYTSDAGEDVPSTIRHHDDDNNNRLDMLQASGQPTRPAAFYPDIDLSIPESVYSDDGSIDLVWDNLRWEAYQQAQREPLLVSFLHSTILNHPSLESSLAFLLANRLQSPAMMISTQLQSLILDALRHDRQFRRALRADVMAVRDRDPACSQLPDVFLYFKGFHALQSYRVAHCLWKNQKQVLAQFLQSRVSSMFQIDIHPNATIGSGMLVDHGTGVVIGSTASVGSNCSILHHVTLGGSGKKGVDRHPKVEDGVLLGAGATVLGPVRIGEGCQVGAGTLVISDLPPHSVAVGVPARIIGSFVDVTEQPSVEMNQMMDERQDIVTFESDGI